MKEKRKTTRANKAQINMLIDYMATHPAFASAQYTGPHRKARKEKQWEKLTKDLNNLGHQRTTHQWNLTWKDLKRRERLDASNAKMNYGHAGDLVLVTDASFKTAKIISTTKAEESPEVEELDVPIKQEIELDPEYSACNSPSSSPINSEMYPEQTEDNITGLRSDPLSLFNITLVPPTANLPHLETSSSSPQRSSTNKEVGFLKCEDESHSEVDTLVVKGISEHIEISNSLREQRLAVLQIQKRQLMKKRVTRPTKKQLNILVDYMATHPAFANGDLGPQSLPKNKRIWHHLAQTLNLNGPQRSIKQWRVCWRDLKRRRARLEGAQANRDWHKNGNSDMSIQTTKLLATIAGEGGFVIEDEEINEILNQRTGHSPPPNSLSPPTHHPAPSLPQTITTSLPSSYAPSSFHPSVSSNLHIEAPSQVNTIGSRENTDSIGPIDFLQVENLSTDILKEIASNIKTSNQLKQLKHRRFIKKRLQQEKWHNSLRF